MFFMIQNNILFFIADKHQCLFLSSSLIGNIPMLYDRCFCHGGSVEL